MKGRFLLLACFCLLRLSLFAQSFSFSPKVPYTYVYRLDSAEVAAHYLLDSVPLFKHKLDSFIGLRPRFAPGMYALLTYRESRLEYEIVAVPFTRPLVNAYNGRVEVILLDSSFRPFKDVRFVLEGKTLAFDSSCQCYAFERKRKKRYFYMQRGDAFLMGTISGDLPGNVEAPRLSYGARPLVSHGYFLLNQPKYQPQDSVKLKAYVLNSNGKAYTSTLKLLLIPEYQPNKPVLLASLKPQSRGAYVYQFKLADTLKLDKKYRLELEDIWGDRLQTASFSIEEYKLRNSTYSAVLEKDKLYKKEAIRFYVQARDANNLPLTDARVKLRLSLVSYSDYYDSVQFIPSDWYHTLLERTQELDISALTELVVPVDSLPHMDMQLKAEISFSNSAGELKTEEYMLHVLQKPSYASLQWTNHSLQANYLTHGKSIRVKAILCGLNSNQLLVQDTVMLPYEGSIYQNCDAYQLRDSLGNLLSTLNLPRLPINGLIKGKRTHDSIFIQSNNPAQLEFQFRIYKDDKLIQQGTTRNLSYVRVDTSAASYNVIYSLVYQCSNWMYESVFSFKERELIVKTNLPAQIYPGQTIPLDIQVHDAFRKPVPAVNLTALGVNAQFDEQAIPELKSFSVEKNKILVKENSRLVYWPDFTRIKFIPRPSYTLLLKAGIITQGDYRLRYPNELLMKVRMPISKNQVELVPFVTGNGKRIPFYSLELDGIPLYVQGESKASKALLIPSGKHKISLRTRSAIYTLPEFLFADSSRYIFSFDTLCLPEGIEKKSCESQQGWSKEELAKLNKHFLVLDVSSKASINEGLYLVQKNRVAKLNQPVYRERYNWSKRVLVYLGLFAEDTMELVLDGKTIQRLRFESGSTYSLFNNRLVTETSKPDSLEYGFRFFLENDESFAGLYDTFNLAPYARPVPLSMDQFGIQKTLPQVDEACSIKAMYSPKANPKVQLVQLDVKGISKSELRSVLFINKDDYLESLLNPEFYASYPSCSFLLKPGLYKVYFISAYNKVYCLNNLRLEANGKTCLALDSLYFNQSCAVLNEQRELCRQLHDVFLLRESMQVSYRSTDYVEMREKLPVQLSASEERTPVVSGFVFDENGNALENVIITLEQQGKVKGISFSDKTGSFLIREIEAGNYQMRLTRFGNCITLVNSINLQKNKLHSYSLKLNKCGFDGVAGPSVYFGKTQVPDIEKTRSVPKPNSGEAQPVEQEQYLNGTGILKGRIVDSQTKSPLDYVTITLYQNGVRKAAALTDDDGEFIFRNLSPGEYSLVASFVGYYRTEIKGIQVERDFVKHVNFTMQISDRGLQEVVIANKKDLVDRGGAHVNRYSSENIMASPMRSVANTSQRSLYSLSGASPNIRGAREDGTAYYIDGVRVNAGATGNPQNAIRTLDLIQAKSLNSDERNRLMQLANDGSIKQERSVFRDYAFWVPNLVTDKYGESHVSIHFPDNITRWDAWILAMNERFQTGTYSWQLRSYKPLSASLFIPSFGLKGDQIFIKGKLSNYTGDTLDLKTRFNLGDSLLKSANHRIQQGKTETVSIALSSLDTLTLRYGLQADGNYSDAETYLLPVLPNGIESNLVEKKLLESDSIWQFQTGTKGTYELRVIHGYSQLIREEIGRLRDYQYGCVEQTTSKLNALLVEKSMCRLLNDSFKDEAGIHACIRRLESQQMGNGSFGWFSQSNPEVWLSFYVVKSLQEASKAGYETRVLNRGLEFFSGNLNKLNGVDKLRALYVLAEAREPLNFDELLSPYKEEEMPVFERLLLTSIKQKVGLPHFSGFLYQGVARNEEGGIFWNLPYASIFQNQNTFGPMAYEVLKKDGADSAFLAGLRAYYFNERNFSAYLKRNTLESAMVLQAMAKDIAAAENNKFLPRLTLNGRVLGTQFPMRMKLASNAGYSLDNTGAKAQVVLANKVFVEKPQIDSSLFKLTTRFVQDRKQVNQLKSAVEVEYQIALNCLKNQEYLLIQIPIPASCMYVSKGNLFGADEVEYKKDRVLLYFRKMTAGLHHFSIRLEPRFEGIFTVLPVQVENMYDSEIKGNNQAMQVKIVGE